MSSPATGIVPISIIKPAWSLLLLTFAMCLTSSCVTQEMEHQHKPGARSPITENETILERSSETFIGYVEPQNATKLHAPKNSFRIQEWTSNSSWIKLQHLPADGKAVKKGDIIGKFEFSGKEARPRVERAIREAEALQQRSKVSIKEQSSLMRTDKLKKALDAKRAEFDTRKGGVVSKRDLRLFELAHKLAEFDAKASIKQLHAYKKSVQAETTYHQENVKKAKNIMLQYKQYEELFVVRAPHEGVVRHVFNRRRGRKIQKGDGMPSGQHFISLAQDQLLAIRFFVPEARNDIVRKHKTFIVHSPTSDSKYTINIRKIEEFPQELGFLKEDNNLPAAREKMYVVHAEFLTQPKELGSGLEIKVSLP